MAENASAVDVGDDRPVGVYAAKTTARGLIQLQHQAELDVMVSHGEAGWSACYYLLICLFCCESRRQHALFERETVSFGASSLPW